MHQRLHARDAHVQPHDAVHIRQPMSSGVTCTEDSHSKMMPFPMPNWYSSIWLDGKVLYTAVPLRYKEPLKTLIGLP